MKDVDELAKELSSYYYYRSSHPAQKATFTKTSRNWINLAKYVNTLILDEVYKELGDLLPLEGEAGVRILKRRAELKQRRDRDA